MPSLLLTVNGQPRKIDAPPDETLLSVLRNRLDLTGTKYGCGEGQCGACTVLLDGRADALVPDAGRPRPRARRSHDRGPRSRSGRLHPVQDAFLEVEAFQCGYCTSGHDRLRGRRS